MSAGAALPGTALPSRPVSRVSLGQQVQDQLRADILFGRLPAGSPLQQERLCERFSVSRMPVRDALNNLVFEGFVERNAVGATVVARLSPDDLSDVLRAEAMLHSVAARRATAKASAAELTELAALAERMMTAADDEDKFEMSDLNVTFHHRINQLAASPKISAALRAVSLHVHRDFLVEVPSWMPQSNAQHAHILRAMADRDGAEVEKSMFAHVWESGIEVIEKLPIHSR